MGNVHKSNFSPYRILNLFSRDVYVVDQMLARVINDAARTSAMSISIVVVIGASFPLFLVAVIPLGWLYLRVMKYVRLDHCL
jgi:ATP-binding cassette, subfamily C (CFTR/MRP), member 1